MTRDEAQRQHFEVAEMVDATRSLWHKTRERAARHCAARPALEDILDLMAGMCGQPTPVCCGELPDWEIICVSAEDLESTIRAYPVTYLEVMLHQLLDDDAPLKAEFAAFCRCLGRNPRPRDFLLEAQAMYRTWAQESDWDITYCPFPPAIDREARQLLWELAEQLVAWSLPRQEAIEEAFRAYIRTHPLDAELAYLCGLTAMPPDRRYKVRRMAPPLHTFLPRIACMRLHQALEEFRAACLEEIEPGDKRMREAIEDADVAVGEILDQYRANLRLVDTTSAKVFADLLNFDWKASREEILGLKRTA